MAVIVHDTAPTTSPLTQDYTDSSLGTPIAAIALGTNITNINTNVNHLMMSVGATDFTNEGAMSGNDEDAQTGLTDNAHIHNSAALVHLPEPAGTFTGDEVAVENGTITNGAQLLWTDIGIAKQVSLIMLNEGIASANFQNVDLPTTGDETVTPGFTADIIIIFSAGVNSDSGQANAEQSFGVYERSGNNYAEVGYRTQDGRDLASVDTQTGSAFRTTNFAMQINVFGSFADSFTIGNFTSTAFDFQRIAGNGLRRIGVLSLKLDTGYTAVVGNTNAPLADGEIDFITGLTGTPIFAMYLATDKDTVTGNVEASFMVGACTSSTNEVCVNGWSEDANSTTSNSGQAHRSDNSIYVRNDTGTLQSAASLVSFTSGTVRMNFGTTVDDIEIGYLVISDNTATITNIASHLKQRLYLT